jgi:hypothetical protein
VRSTAIAVAADTAPSEDLVRAREALQAAQQSLSRARRQRPRVEAAKHAAEQTLSRNHLAELVRGALGSGT